MATSKTTHQFAICIKSNDADLLTPRMIYEILPDASAAKSNHVRVIDNEGEDYLYPADFFMFVEFPQSVRKTLQRIPFHSPSTARLPQA
ncbi:MAG: hypothetical protein ACOYZ8_07210 [Chloroflexota bacterium]